MSYTQRNGDSFGHEGLINLCKLGSEELEGTALRDEQLDLIRAVDTHLTSTSTS